MPSPHITRAYRPPQLDIDHSRRLRALAAAGRRTPAQTVNVLIDEAYDKLPKEEVAK